MQENNLVVFIYFKASFNMFVGVSRLWVSLSPCMVEVDSPIRFIHNSLNGYIL